MGDEEEARGHVATLVRDHANSPAREEAEAWLLAAGPAPPPPDAPTGAAGVTPNPAAAEREPPPAEENPEAEDAPPPVGNYFVQLGAFAEEERAIALYEEVREAGIEVRVVRLVGSGFLHVRFGRFVERADAVEELDRLTAAGISAALVRDERAEELVRN
jgi:cell division septation protein DedD